MNRPSPAAAAALLLLATACTDEARGAEEPSAPRILTFEVAPDRVRELGWVPSGASDGEALAAVARVVERRLAARGDGGDVLADEDRGRLVVTPEAPYTDAEEAVAAAAVESLGLLELLIVAEDERLAELGIDRASERAKLDAWRAGHPDEPLARVNLLLPEEGGPDPRVAWFPRRVADGGGEPELVLLPASLAESFGAGDFADVNLTHSETGHVGIGFELARARKPAFGEFTERHRERYLAIVARDEILSAPRILERLPGAGVIEGRWEDEGELQELSDALRAMRGPLRPID